MAVFLQTNHLKDLIKLCNSSKAFRSTIGRSGTTQAFTVISYLIDPLRGRIDALFFPATLQVIAQDFGAVEVASPLPSVLGIYQIGIPAM
jgi:hypothetical protein